MMINQIEAMECDVLIAGGGIAGMMAAIAAAENGARVIVAEKADTRRSGSGATGNDHFLCYFPPYHGKDKAPILREMEESQIGGCCDIELLDLFADKSEKQVYEWDSWGINMKPLGFWDFTGHAKPGRPRVWLKYAGANQKSVLTKEAKKRNVVILNKTLLNRLITEDGRIAGAVCVDTSKENPAVRLISCKAVIMATGNTSRLYSPRTAGWMFNTANCPACTGGGRVAAYKAGASLINLDLPHTHAGPKFFNRCGKATWIGVYRDLNGKALGPFVSRPTKELGDITGDIWMEMFGMKYRAGEPVYMDCSKTDDEDLKYMMWGLTNEGNTSMLNHIASENIDLKKHMVEFYQFEPILVGRGVEIDKNAASCVPGLYAAGEETGNFRGDIAGSAVFGRIAGESAADYAKKIKSGADIAKSPIVEERISFFNDMLSRKTDTSSPSWKEANVALGQIMTDYAGIEVRSEHLFEAGLTYLRRLRKKTTATLSCSNSHEFMRCLETLDLMDIGELLMLCARERKETRGKHIRVDFPFTNPLNNNRFIKIQEVDGKPKVTWRDKR